ncbi:MAG: amidase family protein [Polyangiaceae bacterium]
MTALWAQSATRLASLLASREVSSVEVVSAHLERIRATNPSLNAFVAVFAEQALEEASVADRERANGTVRGPLHGLPVSVKECMDLRGRPTTLGTPGRMNHVASRDAAIVTALREAGAIVLGRTNLSQFMVFHESSNPLFGRAGNPWDPSRSPGGSSGGEAAALAAGLAPLGFGTDIGGSIRVPAHFTGIVGLKPTLDRWPMAGIASALVGQEAVRSAVGPMARTTADLVLAFQALDPARLSALDSRVPPLPAPDPSRVDVRGLRVGVFTDDGVVGVSPAVFRATIAAADALRAAGATVKSFAPPPSLEALVDYVAALGADGGRSVRDFAGSDSIDPVVASLQRLARLPPLVRRGFERAARASGQSTVASVVGALGEKSAFDAWRVTARLRAYRARFEGAMEAAGIDVLLTPPFATPALPHGGSKKFLPAGAFAVLFNVVQFPAGVVPVTRVRAEEEIRGALPGILERRASEVDRGSRGLPVGVQVVARPWREDLVLATMAALEAAFSPREDFPRTPVVLP